MKSNINEIEVNGICYVPKTKGAVPGPATVDDYAIVRCDRSGVFAGKVESVGGKNVVMSNARCIWYWSGAASLLQMAVDGVSNPDKCKFTVRVPELKLIDAIQIIKCTQKAFDSIEAVKEWKI